MEIFTYSNQHHDGVVKLWHEDSPAPSPWNEPHYVINAKLSFQPELFFVAVQDDEVIGTVMCGYDGRRGWIYSLVVDPKHRRKGFGITLMKRAEESLISLGCVKINLQIRSTNSEVQKFYVALGYNTEDRISMGKQLNLTE